MSEFLEILKKAGWAPITVFVAHLVASEIGGYDVFPPLDTPMHLLGGVAIAFFFWTAYRIAVFQRGVRLPTPSGQGRYGVFSLWHGWLAKGWHLPPTEVGLLTCSVASGAMRNFRT